MVAVGNATSTIESNWLLQVRTMHALDHRNVLKFYAW